MLSQALLKAKQRTAKKVLSASEEQYSTGAINGMKSRKFVKCLRKQFHDFYDAQTLDNKFTIRVESAGKTKEFLHDISVIRVKSVPSPTGRSQVKRIVEVLWQIEIEMSDDAPYVMEDLNKLGAGTATSKKLYVVQCCWLKNEYRKWEWLKKHTRKIAETQSGLFFLAFVPHPNEWDQLTDKTVKDFVKIYKVTFDSDS